MDSSDSGKITYNIPVAESDSDKKPTARKEPIKDNPNLKEPIRGSHFGKRVRQSEIGSTDMDPVVTELDFIGQGEIF